MTRILLRADENSSSQSGSTTTETKNKNKDKRNYKQKQRHKTLQTKTQTQETTNKNTITRNYKQKHRHKRCWVCFSKSNGVFLTITVLSIAVSELKIGSIHEFKSNWDCDIRIYGWWTWISLKSLISMSSKNALWIWLSNVKWFHCHKKYHQDVMNHNPRFGRVWRIVIFSW